ncbi:hypothetical protein MSG28_016219 [Choristoneura fumiferana]|uniref:Uncharacterized protein n=1 Tax=Choristoneura fumiferana TaxID=7141 RepID=A0ACC0K5W5_CHOFU|nr:hypothetical protein MSG28_016219 [Choristoneura fumiferana]
MYGTVKLKPGQVDKNHATYSDKQLEDVLEHAFKHTDVNKDGYIDYLEYRVSSDGQKIESASVYKDDDLSQIVEGALEQADKDNDGFIRF